MSDFTAILDKVMILFNSQFSVFGYNLTLSGVLIGCFVISIVCFAVRKMFY